MIFFILVIAFIVINNLRIRVDNNDYLSQKSTSIMNGIFVLLIFISHSTQYISMPDNFPDKLYMYFQYIHNQWVVTTFLAFSGYGVMKNIITRGSKYINSFPRRRILKTLIHFDIAIVIYLIINTILGIHYSFTNILFSFIGLTSIGNSNWYIFTILLMYIFSYCSSLILQTDYRAIAISVTTVTIFYVFIAQVTGLPSRFVSTVCTYAFGMWIAVYHNKLLFYLNKHRIISVVVFIIPIAATFLFRQNDFIMNLNSCFFVLFVIWFMAIFEIRSQLLCFFGKNAFTIYILQRIPMIIMSHFFTFSGMMKYLFVTTAFFATIGLSLLFRKLLSRIDDMLIRI